MSEIKEVYVATMWREEEVVWRKIVPDEVALRSINSALDGQTSSLAPFATHHISLVKRSAVSANGKTYLIDEGIEKSGKHEDDLLSERCWRHSHCWIIEPLKKTVQKYEEGRE